MYNIFCYIFTMFILFIANINFCTNQKNIENNKTLAAINVSYIMPIVNWDGSVTQTKKSYEAYFYEHLIMYKFYYNFDSTDTEKLLLREKRHYYFIFHKDSIFGYNYYIYPQHGFPNGKLLIDSVLKTNTFKDNKFDSLLNFQPDSSYSDDSGNFVKVYNTPRSIEYPEVFTIYFNYTKKLNGINETFSRKMDNVQGMKLFKVVLLAQGAYYEQHKMSMPKREFLYEMKEASLDNSEELFRFFNKYKKEHQKN